MADVGVDLLYVDTLPIDIILPPLKHPVSTKTLPWKDQPMPSPEDHPLVTTNSYSHNQFLQSWGRQDVERYTHYDNPTLGHQNSDLEAFLEMGA